MPTSHGNLGKFLHLSEPQLGGDYKHQVTLCILQSRHRSWDWLYLVMNQSWFILFPFNPVYYNTDDLLYICKAYYSSHKTFTLSTSFKPLDNSKKGQRMSCLLTLSIPPEHKGWPWAHLMPRLEQTPSCYPHFEHQPICAHLPSPQGVIQVCRQLGRNSRQTATH